MGTVTVLCGPPGCGKSDWTRRTYVEKVRAAGPDAALMLLPTEHSARVTGRRMLADGELPAIVDARIMTFPRFADQLLRANHRLAPEIGNVQQRQVVRTIVRRWVAEGKLASLRPSADSPGLCGVLVDFFDELKRAAIRPEELARRLAETGSDEPRDADVAAVYAEYQHVLQTCRLYDAAGRFWEARDLLREGLIAPFAGVQLVLVDGFADFPTTQIEVLAHLADVADEMVLTLPYAPDEAAPEITRLPERTLERLQALIPRARCEAVSEPRCPGDGLAHVRRHLFSLTPPDAPAASAEQVDVFVADTERDELEVIAEQIKGLLLAEVPAEQIALALPAPATKADLLESVFGGAGIPYTVAAQLPGAVQPLVRLIGCLLGLVTGEFHRNDLVGLIRNPLVCFDSLFDNELGIDADDVYLVLCSAGIVSGRAQWAEGLALAERRLAARAERNMHAPGEDTDDGLTPRGAAPDEIERELAAVRGVRALFETFCALVDSFPGVSAAQGHIEALSAALAWLGVSGIRLRERFDVGVLRRENLRAFDEVCEQMRLYRELCGAISPGVEMTRADFAADMMTLLSQSAYAPGGRRSGAVQVVSINEGLRQRRIEYLFIAGMTQDAYPSQHREGALYHDADRARLSASTRSDLRTREDRDAAERFLFHEALSAATRQLWLSYSDEAGHDELVLPSAFVEEVAGLVDCGRGLPTRRRAPRSRGVLEATGIGRLREGVLNRLFSTHPDAADDGILTAYALLCQVDHEVLPRAAAGAFAEHSRNTGIEFDRYDGVLDAPDVVADVASPGNWGTNHIFSASQLSAYGNCPFRFFAERVLGVAPVREPDDEPDRADLGNLAHGILADFVSAWTEEAGAGAPITVDALDHALTLLRQAAEDAYRRREREQLVAVPELWEIVKGRLLEDLLAWPRAEAKVNEKATPGLYGPLAAERMYGYGSSPPLVIGAGDAAVRIGGYIDLIELISLPDGSPVGYAVYDFKTSSATPSLPDIRSGRELQLPIYIMAAQQMLADEFGALECLFASYYKLHDGTAGRSIQIKPDKGLRDEVLAAAGEHVLAYAEAIRGGRFPVAPTGKQSCAYCAIRSACRYAPWRSEMKGQGVADGAEA